jgi:hypothetical protein
MFIALPAGAAAMPDPQSVLDLEPLIDFLRQTQVEAALLPPPPGADDQPNAAALLTIRERLAADGLQLIPAPLVVPGDAPVGDERWLAQLVFESRILVATYGEAGVASLVVDWRPSGASPSERGVRQQFQESLLEEAERAEVRLDWLGPEPLAERALWVASLRTDAAGLTWSPVTGAGDEELREASRLPLTCVLLRAQGPRGSSEWAGVAGALAAGRYEGPVVVTGAGLTPVVYAAAVGYLRGLVEASRTAGSFPAIRVV